MKTSHLLLIIVAGLATLVLSCLGIQAIAVSMGGVPLNQPVPQPTPAFTAPPGLEMPDPDSYAMLFEDGSFVGLDGESGCLDWWPCDDRSSELQLWYQQSCDRIDAAIEVLQTQPQSDFNVEGLLIYDQAKKMKHCS